MQPSNGPGLAPGFPNNRRFSGNRDNDEIMLQPGSSPTAMSNSRRAEADKGRSECGSFVKSILKKQQNSCSTARDQAPGPSMGESIPILK